MRFLVFNTLDRLTINIQKIVVIMTQLLDLLSYFMNDAFKLYTGLTEFVVGVVALLLQS